MSLLEWLKGKKTYGLAAIGVLIVGMNMLGWVSDDQMTALLGLIGMSGLATLRAGLSKQGKDPQPPAR